MIFDCKFCSICVVVLLCCLAIKRVDCEKKTVKPGGGAPKKPKPKGKGKGKKGRGTTLPDVVVEPIILTSDERERILRGELDDFIKDEKDNTTTVDWYRRKQLKLRPKKQLRGLIYARHLKPRNETPRWSWTPRQKSPIIYDRDTTTTRESKRAIKRRMVKNYSWIEYSVSRLLLTFSTLPPELFTHSSVIVNRRNVVAPRYNATGSVIFLHQEGVKGGTMKVWVNSLKPVDHKEFKHIRFVFPTSPYQPYTPAERELMYIWFDRESLLINSTENIAAIDQTAQQLQKIIRYELKSGIPLERIVIGGIGQGGAMALHMAYRYAPGIAGVFAFGSYLNDDSAVYTNLEANQRPNLPPAHFVHGVLDEFVPMRWSRTTFKRLRDLGVPVSYEKVPGEAHHLDYIETALLYRWIKFILPDE